MTNLCDIPAGYSTWMHDQKSISRQFDRVDCKLVDQKEYLDSQLISTGRYSAAEEHVIIIIQNLESTVMPSGGHRGIRAVCDTSDSWVTHLTKCLHAVDGSVMFVKMAVFSWFLARSTSKSVTLVHRRILQTVISMAPNTQPPILHGVVKCTQIGQHVMTFWHNYAMHVKTRFD